MSAGTANPTTCPRCLRPDAYSQAGATRTFLLRWAFRHERASPSREGHDTSRPLRRTPSPRAREGEDQDQRAQNEGPGMVALLRRRRLRHCRDRAETLAAASCWRPCGRLIAGRLSTLPAGDRAFAMSRRWLDAVPLRDPHRGTRKSHLCRAERDGGARFLVDTRVRSRLGLRHSPSRRRLDACADERAATGADAAGEPATLSAGALLAVTVVVAAATGSAAGASAVEAAPTTAVTAGASAAVAGGARVRDGRNDHRIDVPLLIARGAQTEVRRTAPVSSGTPLRPTVPTTEPSPTGAPRFTPIEPR